VSVERSRDGAEAMARRVRSGIGRAGGAIGLGSWIVDRAWTLRLAPWLLVPSLIGNLAVGRARDVLGLAAALALCYAGRIVVERGLHEEADYARRAIAKAPRPPRKLLGALLVAAGVFVASLMASSAGVGLSLLYAGVALLGCVLAYGLDPRRDKGLAPRLAEAAGVRPEAVAAALTEAEGKIRDIEHWAARLRGRELNERLARITAQARAILRELEQNPSDIRRARRFLVTYLDGTRDVVRKYAKQQDDLADTQLAENFRHVLETIENVFAEQQRVLKRNETLDLEVQIEVLQTQLKREGVA
jgi:hypothetical protein